VTRGDWEHALVAIFRDALAIELESVHVDVIDSGILDSLALVTLLFEVEQRMGIEVPLEQLDLDDLRTVASMAGVFGRLSEQAA